MKILIRSNGVEIATSIFKADTVLDAIIRSGVSIEAYCGGKGTCGKCQVHWVQEEKEVLACGLPAEDGMIIETIAASEMQVLSTSMEKTLTLNPVVLREAGGYGVAFDIGTTTIVGYLVDLHTGAQLASSSLANPQRVFGADVISRIAYTQANSAGVEKLQATLVGALNEIVTKLSQASGVDRDAVLAMSIAGNTVILHTLLGVSAISIANAPFEPVFSDLKQLTPVELGVEINQQGMIFILPSVSGYIGADVISGLLVCDLEQRDFFSLYIDIGTNGEIVLGNSQRIIACSTAAGPAFEGANISCGMAGVRGALSSFHLQDGERIYETIGGGLPLGLCGSGLVDIVAELLTHGFIDETGAFLASEYLAPWQRNMLTTINNQPAFIVVPQAAMQKEIVFTQKDLRELQLAKGAMRAGVFTLLKEADITSNQIEKVFLAGGFGNFVDVHNACVVGLIPSELEKQVVQIGNASGLGATLCLFDKEQLTRSTRLKELIHYIELSNRSDFQDFFMDAMFF